MSLFVPQTHLMYREGENTMMKRVFDLHMVFLRMNQSEQTLKHCFGLIRMFIQKVSDLSYGQKPMLTMIVSCLSLHKVKTQIFIISIVIPSYRVKVTFCSNRSWCLRVQTWVCHIFSKFSLILLLNLMWFHILFLAVSTSTVQRQGIVLWTYVLWVIAML